MKEIDRPIYVRLGNQLKQARLNKKYSLEDVAKMIGKSKASIKRYEDATIRIDMETLKKLSTIYGMTVLEGAVGVNGGDIERFTCLVPQMGEEWYVRDREAQKYTDFLTDLSEKMLENFMHLDIDSQRIVLMMLKIEDVDEILKRMH